MSTKRFVRLTKPVSDVPACCLRCRHSHSLAVLTMRSRQERDLVLGELARPVYCGCFTVQLDQDREVEVKVVEGPVSQLRRRQGPCLHLDPSPIGQRNICGFRPWLCELTTVSVGHNALHKFASQGARRPYVTASLDLGVNPVAPRDELGHRCARQVAERLSPISVAKLLRRPSLDSTTRVPERHQLPVTNANAPAAASRRTRPRASGEIPRSVLAKCARFWHLEQVPLTAVHATAGVLDLTRDPYGLKDSSEELAEGLKWSDVHRVRPRAPLSCRECEHGLHAKVSRGGMRFFAHDAGAPECGLAGESLAHRLLKIELASAIRASGWYAELEVAGSGWRADVLAASPDGAIRMAWEAQLAPATADDLTERTARMAADAVEVCWVTDKDRPFIGHVPSVRIQSASRGEGLSSEPARSVQGELNSESLLVVDGLGSFQPDWCPTRSACQIAAQHGKYVRDEGPCSGHGRWTRPAVRLTLGGFVRHVLHRKVRVHQIRADGPLALGRHNPGRYLWTTHPHWAAEQEQLGAAASWSSWVAERESREREHLMNIAALEARQEALKEPAIKLVAAEARGYVGVRDKSPEWAMGVPLFVHDQPQAVLSPVISRITSDVRDRLRGLTVFVASARERDSIARACAAGQRIVFCDVEVKVPPPPPPEVLTHLSPRQAINWMFGRNLHYS